MPYIANGKANYNLLLALMIEYKKNKRGKTVVVPL